MNVNFGLFPPIEGAERGRERKAKISARARIALNGWLRAA
jgi:methylenetetrahydrofolate--tRNA-(uracil-5-)-methyltransferase